MSTWGFLDHTVKSDIQALRRMWRGVTTSTGRQTSRPTWLAAARCTQCGYVTIASSERPVAARFVCREVYEQVPCPGTLEPLWSDGKPLDHVTDVYERWCEDRANAAPRVQYARDLSRWEEIARRGHANFVRARGCSVAATGVRCPWCEEGRVQP